MTRSGKHKRPRLHVELPADPGEVALLRAAARATGRPLSHWLLAAALAALAYEAFAPADKPEEPE